ncbi:hypothetical protein [Granulicella sp. dw_53]|uniref:hypothetical protein n=1 Tax=Granulicella sp. dw_53 TaxID=2719792 RepID=UPI0021020B08|nr:hypothetical protein [Granulicella sp. dw_53]
MNHIVYLRQVERAIPGATILKLEFEDPRAYGLHRSCVAGRTFSLLHRTKCITKFSANVFREAT